MMATLAPSHLPPAVPEGQPGAVHHHMVAAHCEPRRRRAADVGAGGTAPLAVTRTGSGAGATLPTFANRVVEAQRERDLVRGVVSRLVG